MNFIGVISKTAKIGGKMELLGMQEIYFLIGVLVAFIYIFGKAYQIVLKCTF